MNDDILDAVVQKGVEKVVDELNKPKEEEKVQEEKPVHIDPELVKRQMQAIDVMGRNRKERRRISKLNHGVRIPGLNRAHIKEVKEGVVKVADK